MIENKKSKMDYSYDIYDYASMKSDLISFYAWGSSAILSGLTFVVFLILKLFNIIEWSWWWVTAPIWIYWGLITFILISIILYCVVDDWLEDIKYTIEEKKKLKNSPLLSIEDEAKIDEQVEIHDVKYKK